MASTIFDERQLERDRAKMALAKMKELERKRANKMRSVRLDKNTVISASSKKHLDELIKVHKDERRFI